MNTELQRASRKREGNQATCLSRNGLKFAREKILSKRNYHPGSD